MGGQNFNQTGNPFGGMGGQNFNQTGNPFGGMGGGQRGPGGPGGQGGGPPGMESGTVKQANIQVTVNTQEAGVEIILKDSDDNVIVQHKPDAKYSKILISTPQIIAGANYTLITGTETQTVTASEAESKE